MQVVSVEEPPCERSVSGESGRPAARPNLSAPSFPVFPGVQNALAPAAVSRYRPAVRAPQAPNEVIRPATDP